MTLFSYQAVDVRGVSQEGQLESNSRSSALDALHRRGLVPVTINENSAKPISRSLRDRFNALLVAGSHGKFAAKELVSLTQSLAALLKAGLTIDRALAITANLSRTPRARVLLSDLGRAVRSGRSFADALTESGVALPGYYIGMVQAGEVGGNLPATLSQLGELLRKQHEVRERIRSALIYPAILGCVVLITVILLLGFVLPRFQDLFAESEAQLPWSTRAVLAAGSLVSAYWWLLALVGVGLVAAVIMFIRSPRGRAEVDAWLLRSRWTLGLPAAIDTARLLRTLSTLLANGVPLVTALRVGRATLTNVHMRAALDQAAKRIKAGESTSTALAAGGVFPAHAIQLARVGEETGRMEELLLEAAGILEHESQTSLERLLALFVPVLTILMGLMIAALIGSVLVGLLSINDLAF